MIYSESENFYMIRINEEDELLRADKLGELEELINSDHRAQLKQVIEPISAVSAFLYDLDLVQELEDQGYELIPQPRPKMIE